uniref:Uncharacterized protein n=2 Tax=Nothobranchius kuhntae TaxID=321403 RepID=A0A1A8JKF3_NOTKU
MSVLHLVKMRRRARNVQKVNILPCHSLICMFCGVTPNKAIKGDGSTETFNTLEKVSNIENQKLCSLGQVQNEWTRSAESCLHLSHTGSTSDLILDNLVFDQCNL